MCEDDNNNRATALAQSITHVHLLFFLCEISYRVIIYLSIYLKQSSCRKISEQKLIFSTMRSSHDSYRHSSVASTSNRNQRHTTPSNYLDLNPSIGGSERAEFRDRYQNRVSQR